MPRLRREVNFLFAVIECAPVQHNLPPIGTRKPRDAPKRHALAAARCTEEGEYAVVQGKIRRKGKITQTLFDMNNELHAQTSLFRYRFIAPMKMSEKREMMMAQRSARS